MENRNFKKMEVLGANSYNRPYVCSACGGMMVFKGVGEYQCEDCSDLAYDDYGKVRNYLEAHPGATTAQIAEKTEVSQKAIRQMLKESRLEIATESRTFLKCEICGADIRHGALCQKCEVAYHREIEEKERNKRKMAGYGTDKEKRDKGEKRFSREK